MFRFAAAAHLYLLLLIPALVGLYLLTAISRRKALRRFGDPSLLEVLMKDVSLYRQVTKCGLLLLAVALFAFLLARPQFGSKLETVKRQGVEVVIALDVSNSMLSQDIRPSRLEKSKRLIEQLIDNLESDKVGLVVFAGDAYTQLPITTDYVSAKMFLDPITPSVITKQGTDLSAALSLASRSFTSQQGVGRTVILITDGENHEGGVDEVMKELAKKDVQVNVLGVGSPDGAPIPIDGSSDFRRDGDGNVVVTRLNEQMCQDLARQGNGVYVRVDNTNAAQKAVLGAIGKLAKADVESQVFTEFDEQFQLVAWMLLVLLLAEWLITERKSHWLDGLHLFNAKR